MNALYNKKNNNHKVFTISYYKPCSRNKEIKGLYLYYYPYIYTFYFNKLIYNCICKISK